MPSLPHYILVREAFRNLSPWDQMASLKLWTLILSVGGSAYGALKQLMGPNNLHPYKLRELAGVIMRPLPVMVLGRFLRTNRKQMPFSSSRTRGKSERCTALKQTLITGEVMDQLFLRTVFKPLCLAHKKVFGDSQCEFLNGKLCLSPEWEPFILRWAAQWSRKGQYRFFTLTSKAKGLKNKLLRN